MTQPPRKARLSPAATETLMTALFPPRPAEARTWLLIDAARSGQIVPVIEALASEAHCLFDGALREDLAELAPWLVALERGCDVLDWFLDQGFGNDWGLFVESRQPPRQMVTGLKRSLMVQDEDGRDLYFKFYRPSVFAAYVPALTPEQQAYLLRGIDQVWAEQTAEPLHLLHHVLRDGRLSIDRVPLGPGNGGDTWA